MSSPVCDLIEQLLSQGTSPGDAVKIARQVEVTLAANAIARGSTPDQRERWRLKKERQRARIRGTSPGDNPEGISSKKVNIKQVREKNPKPVPGDVPLRMDDWPIDHAEQFWKAFPPYRRQAKAKVAAKLARIRGDGKVTWSTLFGGVEKFAATNPGEYAPAPMVWLNDGRWDRVYGSTTGGSNGKAASTLGGYSGLGAKLRQAVADEESDHFHPAAGSQRHD